MKNAYCKWCLETEQRRVRRRQRDRYLPFVGLSGFISAFAFSCWCSVFVASRVSLTAWVVLNETFYLPSHLSKLINFTLKIIINFHFDIKVTVSTVYIKRCLTMCQPRSVKLFWRPCYLGNGDDMFLKQRRKWRHCSVNVVYLSKYSQLVHHWRNHVNNFCFLFQNSLKNLKKKVSHKINFYHNMIMKICN